MQALVLVVLALLSSARGFTPLVAPTIRSTLRAVHMSVLGDSSKWARPKKTLIIYEYESSPFSRKVRQACELLDLSPEYRPCPGARYGFSDQLALRTAGERTVPYMSDPGNPIGTLASMRESDVIIAYLFDYFGPGKAKIPGSLKGPLAGFGLGKAASKPLPNYKETNMFLKPMEFWGYEGGPSQPARALLCELCLAHKAVNTSKGSQNLAQLQAKSGGKIPYLEDPNTNKKIVGVNEIKAHLLANYVNKN